MRQQNTAQAHISLLFQIEQWKKSREGVNAEGKKMNIYLKLKKETISKQWYWKSIFSHYVFNRSL